MWKLYPALLGGVAALALAGLASAADDGTDNLFISPCGEPFISSAGQPYPIVQWFNRMDANHDGKVDKAEFTADAEAFFQRLDLSGDGVLTSDEIYVYEHQIVPEILNRGQASLRAGVIRASYQFTSGSGSADDEAPEPSAPKGLTDTNQGAAFYGLFGDPEPVTSADRNFDFRITHKEFIDQSDRHFAKLDPKGQGYFVLADLPRTPAEAASHAKRVAAR